MKDLETCTKCYFICICREEDKDYCYIDKENPDETIKSLKNQYDDLQKTLDKILSSDCISFTRVNTINAKMSLIRLRIMNLEGEDKNGKK